MTRINTNNMPAIVEDIKAAALPDKCKRRSVYRMHIGKCTNAIKKNLVLLECTRGSKINESEKLKIYQRSFPWIYNQTN